MNNKPIFAIHLLTASGAALAFLATMFATLGAWSEMFLTLGIALIVDAIDGPLARRFDIAARLPRWSGETLDLVVDFLTYVFVPAYAIAVSGMVSLDLGLACGALMVFSGALYFADRQMKTEDNYFRGFPALWNLAAFYLFLIEPPPAVIAGIIVALAILTFVPVPFLHPLRVVHWRPVTIVAMVLWAVLAIVTVFEDMAPGPWVTGALCVIAVYFVVAGLARPAQPDKLSQRE
jgi:phosphatidylcholine synthase